MVDCEQTAQSAWGIIGGILLIFFVFIPVGAVITNICLLAYVRGRVALAEHRRQSTFPTS